MKVADVRIGWKKSPSPDIAKVKVMLKVDGTETFAECGPEVEEHIITVKAMSAVQWKVVVKDIDGLTKESQSHDFVLGDLEEPLPATDLFHEILAVREVADESFV